MADVQPSSLPKTTPTRSRARIKAVAALAGAALIGSVATQVVDRTSSSLFDSGDILVVKQINYEFPAESQDGVDTPSPQLYLFPTKVDVPKTLNNDQIAGFAVKKRAIAAYSQQLRLTITASRPESPVIIESLEAHALRVASPKTGWFVNYGPFGCGSNDAASSDIDINLTSHPEIDYQDWPTKKDGEKRLLLIATNSEPVVFDISAIPHAKYVEWELLIHYLQNGKEELYTLHDKSLAVTGLVKGSATAYYSDDSGSLVEDSNPELLDAEGEIHPC